MTITLIRGNRFTGDFQLVAVTGSSGADDREAVRRFNQFVTRLADLETIIGKPFDPATPLGRELSKSRDSCAKQIGDIARDLVAGKLSPQEAIWRSYFYDGQFQERAARLKTAAFIVQALEAAKRNPPAGNLPYDIEFAIGRGQATSEQLQLKAGIDRALTVVKCVLEGGGKVRARKRAEYINALVQIGRVGLMNGQIDVAQADLVRLRDEFVAREAAAVKNSYVVRLGLWGLLYALLTFAFFVIVEWACSGADRAPLFGLRREWIQPNLGSFDPLLYRLRNVLLIPVGAALGAWLAFFIRRPTLGFDELMRLDDELLGPGVRMAYTMLLSLLVGLLFWTGMVAIKVGDFSTGGYAQSGTVALLIGGLCGVASRAAATAVGRRADDFVAGIGGSATPKTT